MKDAPFSFRRLNLDQGSLELTEEYIKLRAYQIWEEGGHQDGHDVEDWLQAETEVFGKKTSSPESKPASEPVKRKASAA